MDESTPNRDAPDYRPKLPRATSARVLTLRYVVALGLVALLVLAGQAVVQYILYSQEYDSRTINLAGRQRMLSRSISEAALAIKLAPTPEERLAPLARLRSDLANWRRVHRGLLFGSEELGLPEGASPRVAALFAAAEPARLAIVEAAQKVLADMEDGVPDQTQVTGLMELLVKVDRFTVAMDLVVEAFENEAEQRVDLAQDLQLVLAGLILLLLFMEALFIFRPLVRGVGAGVRLLAEEAAASAEAAVTDGLTGVPNRRFFDQQLRDQWLAAQRTGAPLALIMADIDLFKVYNDSLGHDAGDRVLAQVARTMADCVHRQGDRVARYGGEEFAVILPQSDLEGAAGLAETMRARVEALGISHPDSRVSPVTTISLGVACLSPRADLDPRDLVNAADRALYAAKNAGRNRVARAKPLPPDGGRKAPAGKPA